MCAYDGASLGLRWIQRSLNICKFSIELFRVWNVSKGKQSKKSISAQFVTTNDIEKGSNNRIEC